MIEYPFNPKSTRDLVAGQYWGVALESGCFACGRVLQTGGDHVPTPRVAFLGGLLAWRGRLRPTLDSIAGARLLQVGVMHLHSINRVGTGILGLRPLDLDGMEIPTLLSSCGGPGCSVLYGSQTLRVAERSEWGKHPILQYWGYDSIKVLAETRLATVACCGA